MHTHTAHTTKIILCLLAKSHAAEEHIGKLMWQAGGPFCPKIRRQWELPPQEVSRCRTRKPHWRVQRDSAIPRDNDQESHHPPFSVQKGPASEVYSWRLVGLHINCLVHPIIKMVGLAAGSSAAWLWIQWTSWTETSQLGSKHGSF